MKIFLTRSLLFFFLLINVSLVYSQVEESTNEITDSINLNRFSLGLKLGIPNVIGGTAEVLLPVLKNRVAPFLDYSRFNIETNDLDTNLTYLEFGANLYFNEKGNGFFISLGQSQFNTNLVYYNLNFNDEIQSVTGTGAAKFNFTTTNLKLGIKTKDTFYFRFEVGFGFGNIPDFIEFTATEKNIVQNFSEKLPPIPGVNSSGIIIGNIGFGTSF